VAVVAPVASVTTFAALTALTAFAFAIVVAAGGPDGDLRHPNTLGLT
jgi:hypothetical protein